MTKSKKILIWIIVVLIASILLGLAVRVGMYYYEYRQDSKLLEFFKENESKSVFRGLVNDDGKPYQQKTVRYDIDGDGKKEIVYAGYDEGKLLFQVHDYDDKDKILNTFTMTGQQGDHLVFNTESGRFVTSDWEDFDKEEDKN